MLRHLFLFTFILFSGSIAMAQSGSVKQSVPDSLRRQAEGTEQTYSTKSVREDLIHPNPTEGVFQLTSIDIGDDISIFDGSGRMVLNTTAEDTQMKIDVTHLEKGIYLVIARDQNKRLKVNQKVMIK
jgi:hypothetical protein